MFFVGQNDALVNTPGILTFLNTIEWHELRNWQRSRKEQWKIVEKKVGWVKKWNNLVFALIRNAGHECPSDQPRATLAMVNNFLNGIW